MESARPGRVEAKTTDTGNGEARDGDIDPDPSQGEDHQK